MLRIHQFFFLNILGFFLTLLLVASIISFFTLKSIIIQERENRLIQNIELLEPQINTSDNLDSLARSIALKAQLRVTIIAEDGIVIAESDTNKNEMEAHTNRTEIMQAMTQPYGVTIRYSKTLKTDFIYVVKKISTPEGLFYFRLSMSLKSVMEHFYSLWIKLFIAFVVLVLIAFIITFNISKKARYDISQITHYLDEVSIKNYRTILKPLYFHEFLQISIVLKNLVKKLQKREKQKQKYTAKLRLINKQNDNIFSAISHEFKNPLAAIMGYTETLYDDLNLDPKIRTKFLEKILSNTQRIALMLDRLALSVKLENNDLSIKATAFDISDVCQESISILQAKYPTRVISYNGVSRMVFGDKTMIELVLTNLIDNALKYSEEEVIVSLTDDSLSVSDKGIGISPMELDKITSKFYRVQKNHWDNSMGLGLSIVKYILKLHNSELHIQSTLERGSTFSFSLTNLISQPSSSVTIL